MSQFVLQTKSTPLEWRNRDFISVASRKVAVATFKLRWPLERPSWHGNWRVRQLKSA
jgi:hypothetical protein